MGDPPNVPVLTRDVEIDKNGLYQFLKEKKKRNTVNATSRDVRNFTRWLANRFELRDVEDIPTVELDELIGMFFVSVRKQKGGEEYEPSSLNAIIYSLERYLQEKKYTHEGKRYSILKDIEFCTTREALKSKRRDLKQQGKGSRPNRARGLDDEEEELMWTKGVFGQDTGPKLQLTLWYHMTLCMGLRGRDEHRKMRFGDVKVLNDRDGKQYLELKERDAKTRDGQEDNDFRDTKQKLFCVCDTLGQRRCIVELFNIFCTRRPKEAMTDESALFLQPKSTQQMSGKKAISNVWYMVTAMGVNYLGNLLPDACEKAGIPRRTNHGVRATAIKRMRKQNVPDDKGIQITGHKSVNSYHHYDENELSNNEHQHIHDIGRYKQVQCEFNFTY